MIHVSKSERLTFIGEPEIVENEIERLIAAALGLAATGKIIPESVASLAIQLSCSNGISGPEAILVKQISVSADTGRAARRTALSQAAMSGALTTQEYMQELTLVDKDTVGYVNADGIACRPGDSGFADVVPLIEPLSNEVVGDANVALGRSLGANAIGYQHEVMYEDGKPMLDSGVRYRSLGNYDEDTEVFTPYVTLLSEAHPAVALQCWP